ncbi:MAG: hypothetical protein KDA90_01735 [Planctomycetaceae bacterium]|nr:hypothetical protein [Planctomycetaceae bacterium]
MSQSELNSGDSPQNARQDQLWDLIHEDLRGIERLMSIQLNLLRSLRQRIADLRR